MKMFVLSLPRKDDMCLSTRTRTRPSAGTHIHTQSTHYITSTHTLTQQNMSIHTHTRPFEPISTLSVPLCLSRPLCLAHSPHSQSHTILTLYHLHTLSHAPTHNQTHLSWSDKARSDSLCLSRTLSHSLGLSSSLTHHSRNSTHSHTASPTHTHSCTKIQSNTLIRV